MYDSSIVAVINVANDPLADDNVLMNPMYNTVDTLPPPPLTPQHKF